MMTRTICDLQGSTHCLEIGTDFPLLDGRPCIFVEVTHERIQLAHADAKQSISVSTGEFWRNVAGGDPTAEDAGELYAYRLAGWAAQRSLRTTLLQLQSQITHLLEGGFTPPISLPDYRPDLVTAKVLEAFDGSAETTRMLARILGQPPETIVVWAHLIGKGEASVPVLPVVSSDEPSDQEVIALMQEETGRGQVSALESNGSRFRWTSELAQQLESDYLASTAESVAATVKEIAERYSWPRGAVQSKAYELKLPQRKREAVQREAETPSAQEDHSFDSSASNEACA